MSDLTPQSLLESPGAEIAPHSLNNHAPPVPSPLNPDAASLRQSGRTPKPAAIVREQREKKDSLKKRESAAQSTSRGQTPAGKLPDIPVPQRYNIPETPDPISWIEPKCPPFDDNATIIISGSDQVLKKAPEHAQNKNFYRYVTCTGDPLFKHKQLFRTSEYPPYGPHMSVEDSDRNVHFDPTFRVVGCEKGWRMSRANVVAREGCLYYEVKIVAGIPQLGSGEEPTGPQPHVRMGWARREAPLDVPVGFDAYSYGITDKRCDTMHRSRPGKFIQPKSKSLKPPSQETQPSQPDSFRQGDVVGLLITLPPLPLHAKVVAGTYNPAVDFSSTKPDPLAPPPDIVRDRIPVIYKGSAYFEAIEFAPTKELEKYAERSPSIFIIDRPNPYHEITGLRTLPGSKIELFKNGVKIGTAFEDLLAFLPPASEPKELTGSRKGLDDGTLGYYPAVSVFSGGVAEVNMGPDFWFPPSELKADVEMQDSDEAMDDEAEMKAFMKPRAIGDRFVEQIAEDVVWDIVDEATFFVMDGGYNFGKDVLFVNMGKN